MSITLRLYYNLSRFRLCKLEIFSHASLIVNPGSGNPVGENNVVQWLHKGGETITYNMGYNNGRLLVQKDGHYYLYSKVTLNAAEECSLIQHRVMKVTKAYDQPIELMKSKRLVSLSAHAASLPASVITHILTTACLSAACLWLHVCVPEGKLKSLLSA